MRCPCFMTDKAHDVPSDLYENSINPRVERRVH